MEVGARAQAHVQAIASSSSYCVPTGTIPLLADQAIDVLVFTTALPGSGGSQKKISTLPLSVRVISLAADAHRSGIRLSAK